MNVKLLRRIQKQILKEPRQFHMGGWFTPQQAVPWKVPNCGTTACIGGWAIALTERKKPSECLPYQQLFLMDWTDPAERLGLKGQQAMRLFYAHRWPVQFQRRGKPVLRAKVAVARIDHFIKTKGKE